MHALVQASLSLSIITCTSIFFTLNHDKFDLPFVKPVFRCFSCSIAKCDIESSSIESCPNTTNSCFKMDAENNFTSIVIERGCAEGPAEGEFSVSVEFVYHDLLIFFLDFLRFLKHFCSFQIQRCLQQYTGLAVRRHDSIIAPTPSAMGRVLMDYQLNYYYHWLLFIQLLRCKLADSLYSEILFMEMVIVGASFIQCSQEYFSILFCQRFIQSGGILMEFWLHSLWLTAGDLIISENAD